MSVKFGSTSTPQTPARDRRQPSKRGRHERESDSSLDAELSYLDLDTGRVTSFRRQPESVTLSTEQFDSISRKLSTLEKFCEKLDKLDKLDSIEITVNSLSLKISTFERRLNENETKMGELQQAMSFISDKYDSLALQPAKVDDLEKTVKKNKTENAELRHAIEEMMSVNAELKEDLLDLKSRSMRDNLIFTNIPESHNENTEAVLSEFLQSKLQLNGIQFERVHRLKTRRDSRVPHRPPPIVAKFSFFKDRETVRKSGRRLAGTNYSIQEQFPEEIERRRKPLYPLLRQARRENQRAALIKDRLYINGREVRPPRVNEAPHPGQNRNPPVAIPNSQSTHL